MSEGLTREDWQAGELWTKFTAWVKGSALALALVVGLVVFFAYVFGSYKSHKAAVAKIEAAPVVLPPLFAPIKDKTRKATTEMVADEASSTTGAAEFAQEFRAVKPVVTDGFTSEFEQKLAEFERKIPK